MPEIGCFFARQLLKQRLIRTRLANGRALPCCIAPFSQHGYDNYTLGDATQETLREIWNGSAYREFRRALL
ncbi:MAG: SPASM domain-containing protein, partial [Pseudolabrys sp.]